MRVNQAALYDLGRISFFANDLRPPYDIPPQFIKKVCPLDTKREGSGDEELSIIELNSHRPAIIRILENHDGYLSAQDIRVKLGIYVNSVRRLLRQLEKQGLATPTRSHTQGYKKGTMLWTATRKVKENETNT